MAQQGLRVSLFERERFPRFHIGESLIPETYWVLKRLNMLPKMQQSHFVKKYSVQFVNAAGKLSAPFYFWDNKPHECSQTWQVVRSEFDKMMLDNAREHGVDVHEGTRVFDVLFEGDRAVGVTVQGENGGRRDVRAKVVVDASGQNGMLQNRFHLRVWDPVLNKSAVWTYWKGAYRDTGKDEGATMVLQTADRHGWFWYIPLHDDVDQRRRRGAGEAAAEGARHARADLHRGSREVRGGQGAHRRRDARHRLLRHQGLLVSRVEARRRGMGADRRRLRVSRSAVFVGRAAGAPLGRDGRRCDRGRPRQRRRVGAQLARWRPAFDEGVNRMRRLVCEYYDGFSFGQFVRNYPELRGTVTDLLIGDLFTDRVDKVWAPMESLYPPGKPPIPAWNESSRPGDAETDERINELTLPAGPRP